MYPAALHIIPTQTVDSSQAFEVWILEKRQNFIKMMTKIWDEKTIKDLEQDCPEQNHDFLSWLLSSKIILNELLSFSWSSSLYVQLLDKETRRKNWIIFKDLIT